MKKQILSKSLNSFIQSGLLDYAYVEGKNFEYDLALGVNPLGHSSKLLRNLDMREVDISNYPEVTSQSLRTKISQIYDCSLEQVLIGAGASELLHLILLSLINENDKVLLPKTTFPALELITLLVRGTPKYIAMSPDMDLDYDHLEELLKSNPKVCILCNPNNPTGKRLKNNCVSELIAKYNSTIFIIDEANIDFGGESFINEIKNNENIIIVRSFSKGFGLAGVRLGFLIAADKFIAYALKRRQTPFIVNTFAQTLALEALKYPEFLKKSKVFVQNQRKELEKFVEKIGFNYIKSDSNYLLVDVSSKGLKSSTMLKQLNAKSANAVDGNSFRGLGKNFIRLSPRSKDINKKFGEIFEDLFG